MNKCTGNWLLNVSQQDNKEGFLSEYKDDIVVDTFVSFLPSGLYGALILTV